MPKCDFNNVALQSLHNTQGHYNVVFGGFYRMSYSVIETIMTNDVIMMSKRFDLTF